MTFEDFVRAHGLCPSRPVVADGRWYRCPTETKPRRRNGAYMLAVDGMVGFARDHASHSETLTWRPGENDLRDVPRVDPALLHRRMEERRREQEEASHAALAFYRRCEPLRYGHEYLTAHGLGMEGCKGLRLDYCGWIVVPAGRDGKLMTVQRISPDGEKAYWRGAPKQGARFVIDRPGASITVICEGLATGLAIFAAAPLTRVVVGFDTSNLAHVAQDAPGFVCVAADNDWETVCKRHREEGLHTVPPWEERPSWCLCNPGRHYAEKVAAEIGSGVALPQDMQGTDWCDWRNERIDERLARKTLHQRESDIVRGVDAEIAAAISRAARFRVRLADAGSFP